MTVQRTFAAALGAVFLLSAVVPAPLAAANADYKVVGVGPDDMLKLRAGPGTGYRVIVGLPEGAQVRVLGCDRTGGTPWCKVSLKDVRQLKGYVSGHYLKQN